MAVSDLLGVLAVDFKCISDVFVCRLYIRMEAGKRLGFLLFFFSSSKSGTGFILYQSQLPVLIPLNE